MSCTNPICGVKFAKQCTVTISGMQTNPWTGGAGCTCENLNGTYKLLWAGTTTGLAAGDPNWRTFVQVCQGGGETLNYSIDSLGQYGTLWHSTLVEWVGPVICKNGDYHWSDTSVTGPCLIKPGNEATITMGTAVITSKPEGWTCHWEATETPPPTTPLCPCPCACDGGGGAGSGGGAGGSSGGSPFVKPFPLPARVPEVAANPVRYSTGEIVLSHADLAGGGFGVPWGHTRSFSSRLSANQDIGQGYNWQVKEWPYLARIDDSQGNVATIVVMGQANATLWFDLIDGQFVGRFGTTQTLTHDDDEMVYRLGDLSGNLTEFADFNLVAAGMFLSHTDAAGNLTQVVSLGDNGGNPGEVRRSDGSGNIESYLYTYAQGADGLWRVTTIVLRRSTDGGASWTNVRRVLYSYWTDGDLYGSLGDLKRVVVNDWENNAWTNLTATLYRYYQAPPVEGSSSSSSSSSSSGGTPAYLGHLLKYVVEPDSYVRLAADPNSGSDPATAPDWVVALYADNYFEYDDQRRVTLESVEGASRSYSYAYYASGFSADYNAWATKTVETLPGGTQNITYANFAGQVMLSVKVPGLGQSGNGPWYEYFRYDGSAHLILKAESSAVTGYDESYADLLNCQASPPLPPGEGWGEGGSPLDPSSISSSSSSSSSPCSCPAICAGNLQYLPDDTGLIHLYDYDSASGQVIRERIRQGEFGCDNKLWERDYQAFYASTSSSSSSSGSAAAPAVYLLTQSIAYPDDITVDPNQSRQIITTSAYTFFPGTLQVQSRTTTWPVVSTAQNGSGVADSRVDVLDLYGNPIWTKDERGFIHYQAFDIRTGAVIQTIADFDTSLSGQPMPPAGWTTPAGGGLNLITDITVDTLGRATQVLGPSHEIDLDGVATTIRRATWTVYQDGSFQVWSGQGLATYSPLPPGEGQGEGASSSSSSSSISGDYNYVLINPVSITIFDETGRVTDQISAIRTTNPLPPGEGWGEGVLSAGALSVMDYFPQSTYCRWTTNQYTDCCKLASTRVYYAIPPSGEGTEGVNYNETRYGYDFLNRRNRVVSPGETITRTVFDARDLPIAIYVGTNDTGATWADPTGGGAGGNNMVVVSEYGYDNGLAGLDGNRTQETQHVDDSTSRVTAFAFDWRDRQVQVTAAQDWYQVTTLDNLDRATQVDRHSQATSNLIGRSQTFYDDRGRVYQTIRYGVDPDTGAVGYGLIDNTWYDPSGNGIKQLPAGSNAFTKAVFDGAGRSTTQYFGYTPSSSSSSSSSSSVGNALGGVPPANDPTDDIIVEQTETNFDAASNTIQTTFRQRFHNATGTGPLTFPGGAQPVARVTYVALYPDAVGRQQAQANYGTNGDVALTRPSTIPARADTVLVDSTVYNSRGEGCQTIDPAGRLDQTTYDDAGRRTQLVLNVQASSSSSSSSSSSNGLPTSDDKNITALWTYTADSQVGTFTAVNASTGDQATVYGFGTSPSNSDIARNDVLSSVTCPDGGILSYLVNRQLQVKQFTDQRLVVHAYDFDLLGRQTEDRAIALGLSSSSSSSSSSSGSDIVGVDGTVQRIARTYEVRGLLQNITSYSRPVIGQGLVVNDVQRVYNSFGQLVTEYQEHSGAVNTSTSVSVQYQYADGSSNTIRAASVVYPSGRVLHYDYGTSGGIDDALSRVASLIDSDGATHLVDYTRLGRSVFVEQISAQPQIAWSLINGAGASLYSGLDQFNRVVDSRWYSTADNSDLDRIQHGYDRVSNRLWRKNMVAGAAGVYLDELYAYDGINRLAELQRGQLNATDNAIVSGTLSFAEAWGLDATGNWLQFWQDDSGTSWGLRQSRSASAANEITSLVGGGWVQPSYDAAGNMIQMPQPSNAVTNNGTTFDAWNRMILVLDSASIIQNNTYDGLNRRATLLSLGVARHFYYSSRWQILEERVGGSTSFDQQFIWGLWYSDYLVLRDRIADRFYAMQDANWNVTAVCDRAGVVSERYGYSAYGMPSFFAPVFSDQQSSIVDWTILYSGYPRDVATGLYTCRFRTYNPLLGVWSRRDPLQLYLNYDLYRYVRNDPIGRVDPFGLDDRTSGADRSKSGRDSFGIVWPPNELAGKQAPITECCDDPSHDDDCPRSRTNPPKTSNCFSIVVWAPSFDYVNANGEHSMVGGHASFGIDGYPQLCGFHGSGFMNDDLDMKGFGKHSVWECCCLSDADMQQLDLRMNSVYLLMAFGLPWDLYWNETYPKGPVNTFLRCQGEPPYPTCHGQAAAFGAGLGCPQLPAGAGQNPLTLLGALKRNKYCRIKEVGPNFDKPFVYSE